MQTSIDLQIFCDANDRREAIRGPFSDDKYTYATDGKICIRVPRIPEVTSNRGISLLSYLKFDHDEMTAWHTLPDPLPDDKRVECKSCNSTGKVIICPDCEGDGEVEYEYWSKSGKTYDANLECPICDGSGRLNGNSDRCEDCNGKGFQMEPVPVKIEALGLNISSMLLHRIKDLPGIMLSTNKQGADDLPPVRFRFDGGDGLIMPMRG